MKKRFLLLPIITALLAGISIINKPKVESASAETGGYHFFIQVQDESELNEGDTVFLGTPGGTVFSALSGNPVFSSGSHVGGRSEDGKKYYTWYTESYQEMLLMRVEHGAYSGTWSFKSLRTDSQEKDYAHPTRGRYLAYGHEYHDKKYSNIQAYGDVNMADGKGQYTSWTLEFRGEEKYAIMKYYGEEFDTHIQWVYYGSTARNNFGYYTGNTDIYLYKEISVDQSSGRVTMDMFRHPDQYTVYEGDYLDLTGLEMTITIDKGEDSEFSFTTTYEIDHNLYTVNPAAKEAYVVYGSFAGWNFVVPVEVIEDDLDRIYFNEVKTPKDDYRGTYVICQQNGATINQMTKDAGYLNYEKESADAPIHSELASKVMIHRYHIIRYRISGTSYMFLKNGSDEYVVKDGNELTFSSNASDLTVNSAVTFDDNLNVHIGDGILFLGEYGFEVGNNPDMSSRAKAYKRMVDYSSLDGETTVNFELFISNFATITGEGCDASGEASTTITTSQWNTFKTKFDSIADDLCGYDFQGYLANTTYEHNQEKGTNSVKDLIDRYDYILSKYQVSKGFDDFMDRTINSAYQINYIIDTTSELNYSSEQIFSNESGIILVAVISAISMTSLVLLLVIKKKRR